MVSGDVPKKQCRRAVSLYDGTSPHMSRYVQTRLVTSSNERAVCTSTRFSCRTDREKLLVDTIIEEKNKFFESIAHGRPRVKIRPRLYRKSHYIGRVLTPSGGPCYVRSP